MALQKTWPERRQPQYYKKQTGRGFLELAYKFRPCGLENSDSNLVPPTTVHYPLPTVLTSDQSPSKVFDCSCPRPFVRPCFVL
ncbi:hypothetical protein HYQ45_015360 [Verticillium longisporum]|uniref:Uncharacterized protein n=1 Tax=Verticillium longisporum TaxID=100787 RepID=A0A8I2Z8W5_VERLO|nr:hypothetical protein HYQ45_015360 [Verticillium longisporum]